MRGADAALDHGPGASRDGPLLAGGIRPSLQRPAGRLGLADDRIASQATWRPSDETELEDAVSAVKDARIIIMNPPFTNRAKMGEKFPEGYAATPACPRRFHGTHTCPQ